MESAILVTISVDVEVDSEEEAYAAAMRVVSEEWNLTAQSCARALRDHLPAKVRVKTVLGTEGPILQVDGIDDDG